MGDLMWDFECAEFEFVNTWQPKFHEVEGSHKEEEETNESLWKPNEISARLLDPDEVHTILQVMVMS